MPNVLISDAISPAAVQIFRDRGLAVDFRPGLKPDELKTIIGDYDGLAVRSATKVTAEILAGAGRLRVVGRAGMGVDTIDVPAATARGVVVMNTPFGNSITTAEHAIAMMFALAREIPQANASTRAGKWEKSRFMGIELTGKVLGIIGCGNIGSIVATRALGLQMRPIAYDPYLTIDRARDLGIEKVELDELLAHADFITLHVPLTEATRNIIDGRAIAKMKKGARIINCARGGLIVEEELKAAIEAGWVGGAAIDVFREEPARESILFGLEQVICTPHLGASTTEAQEKVALQIAEQMSDFLLTGAVVNAVNMPSLSADDAAKIEPYARLAAQLGSFAGQVVEHGVKGVAIGYHGQVAGLAIKPLTGVLLEALLRPFVANVNLVNAPLIARQRDIAVTESTSASSGNYHTLISLSVTTDVGTATIAGTLFDGNKPRIVSAIGIPIEAELGEHMLYIRNVDKPGFVGRLGTLLGDAGVNIGTFHLGRVEAGGQALALLRIDQPAGEALLGQVRAIPQVVQVKSLHF